MWQFTKETETIANMGNYAQKSQKFLYENSYYQNQ